MKNRSGKTKLVWLCESRSREYTRNILKEQSCVIVYIYIIKINQSHLLKLSFERTAAA